MKIIDVISEIPGLNINGNNEEMDIGFKCQIFESNDNISLSNWATNVCQRIVERNRINPKEIAVIINSSISIIETTSKNNTSAPGIGYHIQKYIDADAAFVFELFHSDWGNIIQVAENFLEHMALPYALVMQTNKFSICEKDFENGFCLPDGVSVMLLEKSNQKVNLINFPIDISLNKRPQFEFYNNEESLKNDVYFKVSCDYDLDSQELISNSLLDILEELGSGLPVLSEHWCYYNKEIDKSNDLQIANPNSKKIDLGMHSIPFFLQDNREQYLSNEHGKSFVTYNPFLSYFSVLNLL